MIMALVSYAQVLGGSIPDEHCSQSNMHLLNTKLFAGGSLHALAGCDGNLLFRTCKPYVYDCCKAAVPPMGPCSSLILQRWGSVIVSALLIMLKPLNCMVMIMSILWSVLTSYIREEHGGRLASRAACTMRRGCA
jgi:hypothetical protein